MLGSILGGKKAKGQRNEKYERKNKLEEHYRGFKIQKIRIVKQQQQGLGKELSPTKQENFPQTKGHEFPA